MTRQLINDQRTITATEMRRDFNAVVKRLMVFDKFTREFGREVKRRGLSEEQLMAELEETKREVFRERYGRLG